MSMNRQTFQIFHCSVQLHFNLIFHRSFFTNRRISCFEGIFNRKAQMKQSFWCRTSRNSFQTKSEKTWRNFPLPARLYFYQSRHYRALLCNQTRLLYIKMIPIKFREFFDFIQEFKWVYVISGLLEFQRLCYCLQYIKFGFTISGMPSMLLLMFL